MRLLLDTHILLWLARAPEQLNQGERSIVSNASAVLVSAVSIWELRLKWSRRAPSGREDLIEPGIAVAFAKQAGFELVPLTAAHCATPLHPPLPHRDPFDEQLLIHAREMDARLLTRDSSIAGHPLSLTP